ncbi:hypothetical protein SAMN05660649_03375 [Desulfotomaculum arcticum]|uniref:Uncharacterized protein n=1 Tax=Desulfotruncus arcticus DSM 17038 TaxID=1121424 RepID=A0A1I2WD09_9FIRM|nr:hypothetical protein [Desulfotruncus arcticus]SFG98076.1 hypothetical protein SAMN05660649_03375 [Desulfotomaculum arcticum] [Desulfotruncus arcticus DSM 17038]
MLKTKKTLFVALITCLVLVFAITSFSIANNTEDNLGKLEMNPLPKTGSNGCFKELNINCSIPQTPSEMKVYIVKDAKLSKDDMKKYTSNLGINGDIKENDGKYAVIDAVYGTTSFTLDKKTGSFNYYTKELADAIKPINNLLTDEEYKDIAEKFLKEKGLMKEGAYYRKTLRHTIGKTNQPEQVCLVEAVFTRDLNEIPWTGVGPKMSVYFGDNGKIIGAASVWRDIEEFEDYPLISPQQAMEQITKGNATVYLENVPEATGEIENIELIYLNRSLGYNQKYVIPHYMLQGHTPDGHKFKAITRAIPQQLISEVPYKDIKVESTPRTERKLTPDGSDEDEQ